MAPSTLGGDGVFTTYEPGFARFLSDMGSANPDENALVARNFLLDEAVPAARAERYREAGAAAAHADYKAWLGAHTAYLKDHVWRTSDDHGPPASVDPGDTLSCPETFRVPASSPFAPADGTLDLVRVETVGTIARIIAPVTRRAHQAVLDTVRRAVAPGDGADARRDLDALLDTWLHLIDLRPVFAAFWEDVSDVFGATPAEDAPDWADQLRDRLGLAHCDPADRLAPIDVLVFRYQVSLVPGIKSDRTTKLLLPPTVLDGLHSSAFCPAPRGSLTGHTIDLAAERDTPCREVLHPTTPFRSRHLFRVGSVTRPVKREQLREARGLHLLRVREMSGRCDYAAGTDGDLL